MKKIDNLYIPRNLKTREEIIEGLGREEIIQIAILLAISIVFSFLIKIIFSLSVAVVFFLTFNSATVMALKKDSNTHISVKDQMNFLLKYSKSQKTYKYKYLDEWRL